MAVGKLIGERLSRRQARKNSPFGLLFGDPGFGKNGGMILKFLASIPLAAGLRKYRGGLRLAGLLAFLLSADAVSAQTFYSLPAVDGQVRAFAAHGDTLYIGGDFTTVGGQSRNGIAAIDLTTGSVVSGFAPAASYFGFGPTISSIAVSGDGSTVYFGGLFDEVNGTARGSLAAVNTTGTLQGFAPELNGSGAFSVTVSGSSVYVIGGFTQVKPNGGDFTPQVGFARFDTAGALDAAFNPAPSFFGSANYRGAALSGDGSRLYVSLGNSDVSFAGGDRRGFVALDTGNGAPTSFQPFGVSPTAPGTFSLATSGSSLYVSGEFTQTAAEQPADRLAGFTGETFDAAFTPGAGEGPNTSFVRAMTAEGNALYIAGTFTAYGGIDRTGLAAIDRATGTLIESWDAQSGTTFSGTGEVLFAHNGYLFIGGPSLNNETTILGNPVQYYAALTTVPEPGAAALIGLAVLSFAAGRAVRRRKTTNSH